MSITRHWRTLIHVTEQDDGAGMATIFLPAWAPEIPVKVATRDLPELAYGQWCHAWARIGCENPEELKIKDWEAGVEHPASPHHNRFKAEQLERESA